jgi:hypothetical protein
MPRSPNLIDTFTGANCLLFILILVLVHCASFGNSDLAGFELAVGFTEKVV